MLSGHGTCFHFFRCSSRGGLTLRYGLLVSSWEGKKVMKQNSRFGLLAALSALLTTLAAPAARADWIGTWDPRYGTPFVDGVGPPPTGSFGYDLGWSGRVRVNDSACTVPVGGGDITNAGACGGAASIVSLTLGLYSYPNVTPAYNTLTFVAGSLSIGTLRYNVTGELTGFTTTTESNYQYDSLTLNPPTGAGTNYSFAVQFVLDGGPDLYPSLGGLPIDYSGPLLFARESACGEVCAFYRNNTGPGDEFRPQVAFVQVPEPASLSLAASGLLAAVVALRRRRAAHVDGHSG